MIKNKVIFLKSSCIDGFIEARRQKIYNEDRSFFPYYKNMTDSLVVTVTCLKESLIGPINIKAPSTHDRGGQGIHCRSDLLPRYINRIISFDD